MNRDGYALHFLKNFPPWLAILVLMLILLGMYAVSGDPFYQELIKLFLIGSFLTALGIKIAQPGQPQSNVENVEKMTVNAEPNPLDDLKPDIEGAIIREEK